MLLIFDCDGVVVDSMRLHNEVEAVCYREIGIHIAPEELGRRFAGISQVEEFRILEQETGRSIPAELEARMDNQKEIVFSERLQPIPGIRQALAALKDVPRCLASGARLAGIRHALDIVGLREMFAPHIFSSEMVAKGKPSPDLFLYAAAHMRHDPTDCIVIEDAVAGVQAGQAAGMRVFGFTGGSHYEAQSGDRLKQAGAEIIFSDMHALPELIAAQNLFLKDRRIS